MKGEKWTKEGRVLAEYWQNETNHISVLVLYTETKIVLVYHYIQISWSSRVLWWFTLGFQKVQLIVSVILVGWLFGFYSISTLVGYLMPNPFLYK